MNEAECSDRNEQHWWCEALGFPLVSILALDNSLIGLECSVRLPAGDTKSMLADAFDREMKGRYCLSGFSLENIRRIRNQAWFGTRPLDAPDGIIPLNEYLRNIVLELFQRQGADIVLRERPASGGNPCGTFSDAGRGDSLFYHRLTLRLPPDLLWAAFRAAESPPVRPAIGEQPDRIRIRVGHNQLESLNLTDQHMHLWACMPFDLLWCGILSRGALAAPGGNNNFQLELPGCRLNLRPLLQLAWQTRMLLREFLRETDEHRDYSSFLETDRIRGAGFLPARGDGGRSAWGIAADCARTGPADASCFQFNAIPSPEHLRACADFENRVFGPHGDRIDPLNDSDSGDNCPRSIERQLIFDSLRYLAERSDDKPFARDFWNYIRCRNLYYSTLAQQEGIAGLNNFDHFYRNISRARRGRKNFDRCRLLLAVERIRQTSRAAKLEFRIGPESSFHDWRRRIGLDLGAYRHLLRSRTARIPAPAVGFSIHFAKQWESPQKWNRNATSPNSYPYRGCETTFSQIRYQRFLYEKWKELKVMLRLFRAEPALLFFYRGLDIANRERTVPGWVIAPLFREFRKQLRSLRDFSDGENCSVRHTAHAGEEFSAPASGLRRIFESVQFFGMESGDRIGHGVALGLDLEDWARNRTRVLAPIGEYLEDLCWEIYFYRNGGGDSNALRDARDRLHELVCRIRERFRNEIRAMDCGKHTLVPDDLTAENYYDAYVLQFRNADGKHGYGLLEELEVMRRDLSETAPSDWNVMRDSGSSTRWADPEPWKGKSAPERLLFARLNCEKYWRFEQLLGTVVLPVTDEFLEHTAELQQRMRKWIANHGITVETCPSSNRLIGDISAYRRHPIMRLHPPDAPGPDHVTVSVNADDPMTFNTTVGEEYAHLRLENCRSDASALEIGQWLESIARNAWRTSFVWPSDSPYPEWPDLKRILRKLKEIHRRGIIRLERFPR